ncbi:hypothetical protein CKM354_001237000 [Cercospora kikuchii]|uniref:Glycoside hydrolase family 39 protein n=1 Tax=Cercospora kikuchii TaxID=84275 RepID=A0A9P3FLV5_9PEZI|nr:uncharacterized protein CKM354_001237000 [Cercospora kikuchii]GIZ49338.1 hypothetical protein CKM354_001237000 [Cercospora kikuchii]
MISSATIFTALSVLLSDVEAGVVPAIQARAALNIATVSLTNNTGTPNHLASGIIFGVPDDDTQIPANMYTDWKYNFGRGGGCALPSPRSGWVNGTTEYENRFQQTLGNYRSAQKYGAKFICLFECMYGQWDVENGPYPGDNGDWASWDEMTQVFISDLKKNNVDLSDFIVEIINESDGPWYWKRSQEQAFEMWGRSYKALRSAFGSLLVIQGPSTSAEPSLGNNWWTGFAEYVKTNDVVPDTWTWHMETGGGNMLETTDNLHKLLDYYSLPYNNVNINEYAVAAEQVPTAGAWWIAQLERVNIPGLRGNWQSVPNLYDYLANLVSKPNAPNASPTASDYYPVGEYQVYKYYAQNMTGNRLGTMPSGDMALDVYATQDTATRKVKVLSGVRLQTGTWTIEVSPVSALGLPPSGSVTIECRQFDNNGPWGAVNSVGSCGTYYDSDYANDMISITLYQNDKQTAYAWEISY